MHGSRSEGFEFEIDFGTERTAMLELLELPLPRAVSLGCCWSARSPESSRSLVASLACLLAGASFVLGGLWDLSDEHCGTVLAAMYDRYAQGAPLPVAFRRALLCQPTPVRTGGSWTLRLRPILTFGHLRTN
ncbi:CHAT domain-containing protein [Nocardia niigatensis]|uniref:CHAT domain-containing protein n=1 Tax=Nocardia niigatensis TaxID=209249 RepID=UPI0003112890|nr:CHAT domain-containing protein [Nocardia niigatensis]